LSQTPGTVSILATVSGNDQPGITSRLTGVLAREHVRVLDIAQALIHHLLSLSIWFEVTEANESRVTAALRAEAESLGLKLECRRFESHEGKSVAPGNAPAPHLYAITVIASEISAQALHRVTDVLARAGLNLDIIKRLSSDGFGCVEMQASSALALDEAALKGELLPIAWELQIDIGVQPEGLYRRSKRLVALDMDSTLIQSEVIDELAREKGVYAEVAAITHSAMMGKMNFEESLRQRCQKLAGLPEAALERVLARIELTPGAQELIAILKTLGFKTAVISGGFTFVADSLKKRLGLDYAYANVLEILDGVLTGKVIPPIVNAERKAELLDSIAKLENISLDQVIAVGDGANDLLMLEKAGLGIAFNAKPAVRERADLALTQKNLRSIVYFLGLSERDLALAGFPGPA
jgi:phosphoserine phosphatase